MVSPYLVVILAYLIYSCTEDKIAFFIPLQSKDGTFVLAKCTGQVSCWEDTQKGNEICEYQIRKTKQTKPNKNNPQQAIKVFNYTPKKIQMAVC